MALILKGRSRLRGSTIIGKRPYMVEGQFNPEFVLDFQKNYYRTDYTSKALTNTLTHAATSNATMTDASGNIVWRPHNLLPYSEDFSNAYWVKTATTVIANAAIAPDGLMTADQISHTSTVAEIAAPSIAGLTNVRSDVVVYAKYVDHQWLRIFHNHTIGTSGSTWFDIQNGVVGTDGTGSATITDVGNGWYMCRVSGVVATSFTTRCVLLLADGNNSTTETSGTSAYIWGAHVYRSDLGGMADVPADARAIPSATKYVRTAGRVIGSEALTGPWVTAAGGYDNTTTGTGTSVTATAGTTATRVAQVLDPYLVTGSIVEITVTINSTSQAAVITPYLRDGNTAGSGTAYASGSSISAGETTTFYAALLSTDANIMLACSLAIDFTATVSVKEIDINPATARYMPRVGHHVYNGTAWVNEGLLHESEARTNILTYSEDLSNAAAWFRGSDILTANQAVAPDGNTTADEINIFPLGYVYNTVTVSASTTYTASWYIKAGTATAWVWGFYDQTNAAWIELQQYNIADGQDIGNGWYRFSVQVTTPVGCTSLRVYPTRNQTLAGPVSGSEGTSYIWGAQLEQGSTPSSYIPTAGATVTRAAETLTIPAANLPWPSPEYVTNVELVTNGGFDTDLNGWTAQSGAILSWSSGTLVVTNNVGDNFAGAYQTISTQAGSVYRVAYDVVTRDAETELNINDGVATGSGIFDTNPFWATGPQEFYFVAQSSQTTIYFVNRADGGSASFDNISVKEINPLALSIAMDGRMTYADTNTDNEAAFVRWWPDGANYIYTRLDTNGEDGQVDFFQANAGVVDSVQSAVNALTQGIFVPFNLASRHGSTFINGAVDGIALTADTTPVALPDLSATNLQLGYTFMGTIGSFRIWADDIGDAGLVDATKPSLTPSLSLTFDGTEASFVDLGWSE